MKQGSGRSDRGIIVFLAFGFSLFIWLSPLAGQKITKDNGVQVIHNPKDPIIRKGVPSTPVLKEDLVIGAESGDEKYMFADLDSIQADEDGNIYALDDKDIKIKVFDRTGAHLRTFGKNGQGPGELQSPNRLFLSPKGQLALVDSGNDKLVLFSKTGECLSETPLGRNRITGAVVDGKGRIYGGSLVFKQNEYSVDLARYDSKMGLEARISEITHPIIYPKVNPLYERLTFVLMSHDRLAWASMKSYEISILDPEQGVIRKISKDYDRRAITDKDREDTIKSLYRDGAPAGVSLAFPGYFSPLHALIADEKDFLYVRTNEKDKESRYRYDVFDAEGRCFAKIFLPASERLSVVRAGKLYCLIRENEAGIPQIKRYSLAWK